MYDVSPHYRDQRFWELAQIGVEPAVYLERARDRARLRPHQPPTLYTARDQRWIDILTGAVPDCRPQSGRLPTPLGGL